MKATGSVLMTTVNPQIMLTQLITTGTPTDTMVEMMADQMTNGMMGLKKNSTSMTTAPMITELTNAGWTNGTTITTVSSMRATGSITQTAL